MTSRNKVFFTSALLFFLLIAPNLLIGQTRITSPYSRYGIGELAKNRHSVQMAMGGISQAFNNPRFINSNNPASYANRDTLSFIFEGAIQSDFAQLQTDVVTQYGDYASLGYLRFAFPIGKKMGASFGLNPYSNVGYLLQTADSLEEIGSYTHFYEGMGGINQAYLGFGIEVLKGLSLGVNAEYLFGSIDHIQTIHFDSSYYLSIKNEDSRLLHGLKFDFGLQYQFDFGKDNNLGFGLTYGNTQKVSSTYSIISRTLLLPSQTIKDTAYYNGGEKGHITFPSTLGFGVQYKKGQDLMIGADFKTQNWSEYRSFDATDSLKNSFEISVGAEYLPNRRNAKNYLQAITYRAGLRYNKSYLSLNNRALDEYGISFGFGLPLKRNNSTINLGFEVGKMGTTDQQLIKKTYGSFTLGVSIYEHWFYKRRLD